jgi:lysophospholipase L1-like esterase
MSNTPITEPINYLALGDSTGVGVGARNGGYVARLFKRIVAARPDSQVTNLCVSGATTADVLRDQLEQGLATRPNLITLGIGINDIGHGVSIDEFAKNFETIVSRLRNETGARIVVSNLPDISSAPRVPDFARGQYQQMIAAFNQRLEAIAAHYDVTVFDVQEITHEQLPAHPEFFSSDGFHPSDAGYELWADEMWPVMKRTIGL